MKLVSKFQKKNQTAKLNVAEICALIVKELNTKLVDGKEVQSILREEIKKFESMNGFINIFLTNEQFMDRVHIVTRKQSVSNKDARQQSEADESF